jgi:hypothetical protein
VLKKNHIPLLVSVVFISAWAFGYAHRASMSVQVEEKKCVEKKENLAALPAGTQDRVVLGQSAATRSAPAYSPESLSDPGVRASLESKLREVPYAVLKQIYLERQDEQWEKQQARYSQARDLDPEELDRRANRLLDEFQRNSGGNSHYISRGEMRLRGAGLLPYVALVEYYVSGINRNDATGSVLFTQSDARGAVKGEDLCFISSIYFLMNGKYETDGQSTCMKWASVKNHSPFVIHSNYGSKALVPYFDSVSIALPGFNDGAKSEWYDATKDRWTSLGSIRFDPVTKDEFTSVSREIQVESRGN